MPKKITNNIFAFFPKKLFGFLLVYFSISLTAICQPAAGETVSQRFVIEIDDLFDLGFVDEDHSYMNTSGNDLNDLAKGVEHQFRIRSNDAFNFSVQMTGYDSTGNMDSDGLVQVKTDADDDGFKDVSDNPVGLLNGSDELQGKTFTIECRTKPGAKAPTGLTQLDLIFTASYP